MELFHIIDEGAAILKLKGGVYKQAKIYRRGDQVFAEAGSNTFIRLVRGGGTTKPAVTWLEVEGPGVHADPTSHPKWIQPPPAHVKGQKVTLTAVGG